MTAKTQAQRNAAYRTRKAEKIARMEAVYEQACAALLEHDAGGVTLAGWRDLRAAVSAVNPVF